MGRRTKADPTGQAKQRKITATKLKVRLGLARREISVLFSQIPRKRSSETQIVNQLVYDYDITPEQMDVLLLQVDAILDEALLETTREQMPANWWFQDQVEKPYRQGVVEETVVFNKLIAGAIIAGTLVNGTPPRKLETQSILTSTTFAQGVRRTFQRGWAAVKTLARTTSTQVGRQIRDGIAAKLSPAKIRQAVNDRFRVARSSADRTAATEVNWAYTDGKLDLIEQAQEETGLDAGVLHISALLTTTRVHHAARHGNAYTVADQETWWNQGSNRVNCHCSVQSILVDKKGNLIDAATREEVIAERSFFEGNQL